LSQQATATARALPSFPTRRSSDLLGGVLGWGVDEPDPPHPEPELAAAPRAVGVEGAPVGVLQLLGPAVGVPCQPVVLDEAADCRSEEHTSELQSRENLVCRLLLEK